MNFISPSISKLIKPRKRVKHVVHFEFPKSSSPGETHVGTLDLLAALIEGARLAGLQSIKAGDHTHMSLEEAQRAQPLWLMDRLKITCVTQVAPSEKAELRFSALSYDRTPSSSGEFWLNEMKFEGFLHGSLVVMLPITGE